MSLQSTQEELHAVFVGRKVELFLFLSLVQYWRLENVSLMDNFKLEDIICL